jgi:hypothetical protein
VSLIKTIVIHESSVSEIERFLAEEDPPYLKLGLDQAYNFVDNLSPYLKHSQGFLGIKFDKKSIGNSEDIPTHNRGYSQIVFTDSECEICLFWIDKYYTDIPILRSQIKTLTVQVDSLTDENNRLKSIVQRQEKHLKTSGNIIVNNAKSVTTVVNSDIL